MEMEAQTKKADTKVRKQPAKSMTEMLANMRKQMNLSPGENMEEEVESSNKAPTVKTSVVENGAAPAKSMAEMLVDMRKKMHLHEGNELDLQAPLLGNWAERTSITSCSDGEEDGEEYTVDDIVLSDSETESKYPPSNTKRKGKIAMTAKPKDDESEVSEDEDESSKEYSSDEYELNEASGQECDDEPIYENKKENIGVNIVKKGGKTRAIFTD